MAVDAKNDGGWVGRSIRRLEDPTLVAGHGRFTGDLPAARWVRFVRSSVASGRIKRIVAPQGATVVTAAELAAVKPIQPLLHKFSYVPIRQPVLAGMIVLGLYGLIYFALAAALGLAQARSLMRRFRR